MIFRLFLNKSGQNDTIMSGQDLVEKVRYCITEKYQWVLFSHGTIVALREPVPSNKITENALAMLAKYGPVTAASEAGDFNVSDIDDGESWFVSGWGPGMYTYVHKSELPEGNAESILVGLYGREKRHLDSIDKKVIYINNP